MLYIIEKYYCVYEVSKNYKNKLIKKYKNKNSAYNFMNKSIYRYIKEKKYISFYL